MIRIRRAATAALAAVGMSLLATAPAHAEQKSTFRIGFVTFLSGPAAGPFGVPAKLAAEAIVESLNNGKGPAPYQGKGIGGLPIELVIADEAGGGTKQVSEFRSLVQRQNVDAVIGYIGSGDCLAIAPVAEEMKVLTVLFDCGTPRVFEEASYKYVFRTRAHATMDAVAATLYLLDNRPAVKRITGINQNYAYGQDSWNDFEATIKTLRPDAEIVSSQMPKFGAGQYGAEISALLSTNADVIHSSLWGGDLEAFMLQAQPRDLFKRAQLILVAELGAQAIAVGASFVTVFVLSYALFWIIKKTVGLRVSAREEMEGLDISEHGMWGYPESFMPVLGGIYRPADTPTVMPHHSTETVPTHGEVARA